MVITEEYMTKEKNDYIWSVDFTSIHHMISIKHGDYSFEFFRMFHMCILVFHVSIPS